MSLVDCLTSSKEFATLNTSQHIPKANVYKVVEANLEKVLVVVHEFKFRLHMNVYTALPNGG
jgi:hypothetical protein